jgi:hypothetical protein
MNACLYLTPVMQLHEKARSACTVTMPGVIVGYKTCDVVGQFILLKVSGRFVKSSIN